MTEENRIQINEKLTDLISNQTECIEKLEKENSFLKSELSTLKKHLQEVVSENEALHAGILAEAVDNTLKESQNTSDHTKLLLSNNININVDSADNAEDVDQNIADVNSKLNTCDKSCHTETTKNLWNEEMKQLQNMYQHKIEVLQIELNILQKDLSEEKLKNAECNKIINRMGQGENLQHAESNKLENDSCYQPSSAVIERLANENKDLIQSVKDLRKTIATYQEQEGLLRQNIQKGFAAVEEIQLEKMEVSVERDQLKKDLKEAMQQLERTIAESQTFMYSAAEKQKDAVAAEFAELQEQLSCLMNTNASTKYALDNALAENSKLRKKLDESCDEIMEYEKKIAIVRGEIQQDYKTTADAYSGVEEELRNSRIKLESEIINVKHDKARTEQLCEDLTKRLKTAEENFLNAQDLNLSLTEQLNTLKSELNATSISLKDSNKQNAIKLDDMKQKMQAKINELCCQWKMTEAQYETRLNDLELISAKQSNLIKELTRECLGMEKLLNSVTDKYRKDVGQLSQDNEIMAIKIHRMTKNNKDLSEQCVKHGKMHKAMQERMCELNFQNVTSNGKILDLLSKSMISEATGVDEIND